jgi:hypothetical protein
MQTASTTLTPAELLVQDQLFIDAYNIFRPWFEDNESLLHEDLIWQSDLEAAVNNIYDNYGGWLPGTTENQKGEMLLEAVDIISSSGGSLYIPPNNPDGRSPFEKCMRKSRRRYFVRRDLSGTMGCTCCHKYNECGNPLCKQSYIPKDCCPSNDNNGPIAGE